VAVGYRAPQQSTGVANATTITTDTQTQQTSVDEVVATGIAANLAATTNLSVADNVANLSVSLNAKSELAQSNDAVITKPQIIQPTSNRAIVSYTAATGDTVDNIAAKNSVSKDTVKWANNLTSDAVSAGATLKILPTDGILYTVKSGDTVQSIADKYKTDQTRIVLYNDLDEAGISVGSQIIVPGGVLPETERPGYVAPRVYTSYNSGYVSGNSTLYKASAGNRYTYGYCTWYVYNRRAEMGRPIGSFWGNASSWAYAARSAGYVVDNTPEVGAIMQNGGGLGHVAVVESIAANGDITLSEMNNSSYGGWGVKDTRSMSAGQAASFTYIH
jgi:N-acetylmuramoyl-L-alanine amidase